ncbi:MULTISPECIES: hypothetical protein [Mycolicibacter]|uniref:Uncharacterized protein n=2 Tax=Mycolicibacter TaxID=1073531 RepID=A0ABU5XMD9_9MYCO|nr:MULTISPECIES: hypothetical protein [unclassified Mycolicibacter]MEB3023353.1 hypothetical protein [Mycolicibacter sp. MYC098]MEB3033694.1 hypothetical protein [Mycolicibacter sp. MYC340]
MSVYENDPVSSKFDGYAVPTPPGDWRYALDESGVFYRREGWPFGREPSRVSACQASGIRSAQAWKLVPASVRVSPDVAYQSWRNEYVLLHPGRLPEYVGTTEEDNEFAHAYLDLWVRKQGLGGIVVPRVAIELDMHTSTVRVDAKCPAEVRGQAELKARRLLEFLVEHQEKARRPRGRRAPGTSHDAWAKSQSR